MDTIHKQHPYFGHTITDRPMEHHSHPLSLNAPVVHLTAVIKEVKPDAQQYGVDHMHFIINQVNVIDIKGADPGCVGAEIFCAVRYGDSLGLPARIPGLKTGQEIEMQGEYIDVNHVYHTDDNSNDPVLHFTHHPVGFVIYQGIKYE